MRKKQWIALGFLFMIFAIIMSYFAVGYSTAEIQIRTAIETTTSPSNELIGHYIVANIRYMMFSILTSLTNKRIVVIEAHVSRDTVFASVPLNSLVLVEPYERVFLFFRTLAGFSISYEMPLGLTEEIRFIPGRDIPIKEIKKWTNEWIDCIRKTFEQK